MKGRTIPPVYPLQSYSPNTATVLEADVVQRLEHAWPCHIPHWWMYERRVRRSTPWLPEAHSGCRGYSSRYRKQARNRNKESRSEPPNEKPRRLDVRP